MTVPAGGAGQPPVSPARWTLVLVASLVALVLLATVTFVAGFVAVMSSPPCGAFAHTGSCSEEESADIERDFQLATLATVGLGLLALVAGVVFVVATVRVVRASRLEARARGQAP